MLTPILIATFLLVTPLFAVLAANSLYELRRPNSDTLARLGWGFALGFSTGMLLDLAAFVIGYTVLLLNADPVAPRIAFAVGVLLAAAAAYVRYYVLKLEDSQAATGNHAYIYLREEVWQ